ncbi:metalloregulator ArsR/SmtB family transcription factor [Bacillus sp. V5-8f]|uniref:ArsR/SmtB family transcription factor n=1 Tax=Bacillus sp. V5-8f TaxID=2053044 RepID=UPI000C77F930|nr:metalloregulator ArsR/SmtB family transcription factor [Bacillus sp. V5-8f]PLT35622.1 ArsR family transcriptional regulator [Bacillus sp. V5-8f]
MQAQDVITIESASSILKLLGDKTRLSMVKIMMEHECCVCELVDLFEISQPAISQHVRKLKDSGLIKERRCGQWIYYSLNSDYPFYPFILDILHKLPSQRFKVDEIEFQGRRVCCD